jgi:hypothetical protein
MTEHSSTTNAPETTLQRLSDLSRRLLGLHKALLDRERARYEQIYGRVSSNELLQLLLHNDQFAWLRLISELIVQIDESLDADEPLSVADAESLLVQVRTQLTPSETGDIFQRNYFEAIQQDPDIVLAHREVRSLLS